MIVFALYIAIFVVSWLLVKLLVHRALNDFTARKTVTFGDESAVRPSRIASVVSILTIFLLWGAFTGSTWVPKFLHAPGPFVGDASFTYTAEADGVEPDEATVTVRVFPVGEETEDPEVDPGDGWAKNDSASVGAWRSGLVRVDQNDDHGRDAGHRVVAVNGQPIEPGGEVITEYGRVGMSPKGTLNFEPAKGWQMEPIWLPAPEAVLSRLVEISRDGYRDSTLWEHLGWSLFRVIAGFFFGALIGIPLGYAMGLSDWFRGWFDPIVEFMRPVPPLALIPLVIIWAGIGEAGKIILLFLAALWIMAIAARSGVSGVKISKVHAAYSLGASKVQILRHVIIPNSLPDIFTGARVAMGVCWGTVVAAELVAAEKGAGMMIMVASKFQLTDIVIMGIILIGVIGFGIDMLMRLAERKLVPWKGRG
ncbi:ABC transporter permease [Alloyangia pacifica]|uniref:Taurine transport system permease protein n=1 Tax=Alloyangia pacifica TaxID=311180 RepID=A0A1I6TQ23_9RHOB|nr:ABC transporter permease subunit [Alloyangia pacifica]SDH10659.1 taurine transport system permease protein [Alloyangia pacifica]SFS91323.1 taurine transport system permease protein [Alloyangia pacifica]